MTRGSYTTPSVGASSNIASFDLEFANAPRPPPINIFNTPIAESETARLRSLNEISESDELRGPNIFAAPPAPNPASSYTVPGAEADIGAVVGQPAAPSGTNIEQTVTATRIVQGGGINYIANLATAKSNPLNKYSSYNCLFTLACLTIEQQNTGIYNSENISNIVTSSKGDWNNNGAKRVGTTFGKFDYFIDDLIIANMPSLNNRTGNSFANKISFSVTEPYSMGLFLLTLQQGALQGGYENYREAAYLLVIEWAGYDDNNVPSIDASLTRYIPIRFIDVTMKVTPRGTEYECEAIPYNEIAVRDSITQISASITISGSNVNELLAAENSNNNSGARSLVSALKGIHSGQVSNGILQTTDEYVIIFPRDFTDTENSGNEISRSVLFTGLEDNGTVPFPPNDSVFDNVRKIYQNRRVTVTEKKNFAFPANTKIEDIITDVVIRSDYIAKQLTEGARLADPNGMINWFRIESQVIDIPRFNPRYGRQDRRYIYRVVPYRVHVNRFLPPNVAPAGYQNLVQEVQRIYDYVYSGKNTEILNINLDFKMGFYTAVPADASQNTSTNTSNFGVGIQNQERNSVNNGGNPRIQLQTGAAATNQLGAQPIPEFSRSSDNGKTRQIKLLQAILQNPADLVNLEIEIMGDPYYLPSSGMGNQLIPPQSFNLMRDGSFNYQSGEVDILVRFRTPLDLDLDTGLYKFAQEIDQLSGLFYILEVESKFNNNKFTQVIKLIRRRVQLGSSATADQNQIVYRAEE